MFILKRDYTTNLSVFSVTQVISKLHLQNRNCVL